MAIYSKAPLKHVGEFVNLPVEDLFASPALLAALEGSLAERSYADNAAALAAGLKVGQLYINTTDNAVEVVV